MKLLMLVVIAFVAILYNFSMAEAAPFKAASKNPNVVAYYPSGTHGIADEPGILHEGQDLVMRAGKSGNFQQWFYGFAAESGGIIEGDHTVWKEAKNGCASKWTRITDAYPAWGDYLNPGADYCVKTNDFKAEFNHQP